MDAKWGHGRAEAAAYGCQWHGPRSPKEGISYHTITGASKNLNTSLGCNQRLLFAICRLCWSLVPSRGATHPQVEVPLEMCVLLYSR